MASDDDASSECSAEESSVACEEELLLQCEEAENEVAELEMELRAAEAEAKQLKMRLQAASAQCARSGRPAGPALGPAAALPPVLGRSGGAEQRRLREIVVLLEWLGEHVDLGSLQVLDVAFEVPVGGRVVHLRRVAQWSMPTAPGGRLRLSVPADHQDSIAQLLAYIKACGGRVDAQTAGRFAAVWDLVPGELATTAAASAVAAATGGGAAPSPTEPSVVLARRGCAQGLLIATWPTREALEASGRLPAASSAGGAPPLRVGDRVEVEYQGAWFGGSLQALDQEGSMATIHCDADPAGVVTLAPVARMRRPTGAAGSATAGAAGGTGAASAAAATAASESEAEAATSSSASVGEDSVADAATAIAAASSTTTGTAASSDAESAVPARAATSWHRRSRSSAL